MLNQKQKSLMSKAITELEKNILGALMGGANYIEEVFDDITPDIFHLLMQLSLHQTSGWIWFMAVSTKIWLSV